MKPIGKHFSQELAAAGLFGLPFSWGDDGAIAFAEVMTEAQKSAVLAVYEAHDPNAVPIAAQKLAIDMAAEVVRLRYLDGQPTKAEEYRRAYDAAVNWLADQTQPVPASIQTWVDTTGWTALQATSDIKSKGDWLNAKLDQIRDVRLKGKEAVAAGTKTMDQVIAELGAL